MNNKFTQSSTLERAKMTDIFNKFNITTYDFTDEKGFAKHDGTFVNSKNEKIMFEVKVRAVSSKAYKTTVIEKAKYDYLLDEAYNTGSKPYVFVFFNDGNYMVQNLETAKVTYSKKQAPRTTAGSNEMITKHFTEIEITNSNTFKQPLND